MRRHWPRSTGTGRERAWLRRPQTCSLSEALSWRKDGNLSTKTPEEGVRQRVIAALKNLGWKETQLQWWPEWRVPAAPKELTKRERGQAFKALGQADLAAFADDSREPHALQVLFEFKAPSMSAGAEQLKAYLAMEPVVRMGYWTNGDESLAIYKSHTNDWLEVKNAPLPYPGEDLTAPPKKPPTWNDLRIPTEGELSAALRRIVATVVVGDTRSTRREDQLRELLHVVLVKIESDAIASSSANRHKPVDFRIYGDKASMIHVTAEQIRKQFKDYFAKQSNRVFNPDDRDEILLTEETIFAVVDILFPWRILGDQVDLLSKAFQTFRTKALKSGEGQFLTPQRVIRPCVSIMEIKSSDKVIDPACGTGGFIVEALRQVQENEFPGEDDAWKLVKFANENLYGVDTDSMSVKLARAMMIAMRDGSAHVLLGDAVRQHTWPEKFPRLKQELGGNAGSVAESFTVVLTNPPFGQDLKVKAADARASGYTIAKAAASGRKEYVDLEIGLIYLELAHRLLQVGGRVGIVLPETYFFSFKYKWLSSWLKGRFELRGMFNIAMEAFEEFCRAKTNFYVFEKVGNSSAKAPSWFSMDTVTVSTAPTCGLAKGGRLLPLVDPKTGASVMTTDPETGESIPAINDVLLSDAIALRRGERTDTMRDIPASQVLPRACVPVYYDRRYHEHFISEMKSERFRGFHSGTLAELAESGVISIRGGHGSPSSNQRVGDVPYIKVSDLRAGFVNINPTNRVPRSVAEHFWKGQGSGLQAFDILCPERTSKNIGDFCVLMPGQEQLLLTKEIIILRPGCNAEFDPFYLLWAMTLKIVRDQWKRVVFMQTNREDVGDRYLEIEIPVPNDSETAAEVSRPFRNYYHTVARARTSLGQYLADSGEHHFFVVSDAENDVEVQEEEESACGVAYEWT